MITHPPHELPELIDYESKKLVAMTTKFGFHVIKVTHYGSFDEDSSPHWSTACSEGWTIDPSEILWWAYADDVADLLQTK